MYEYSLEQSISLRLYDHGIFFRLVLREKPADWSFFDHVLTSSDMGERSAQNLGSYRLVLKRLLMWIQNVSSLWMTSSRMSFRRVHWVCTQSSARPLKCSNVTSVIFWEILSSEVASFSGEMLDSFKIALVRAASRRTGMLAGD